MIWFEVTLTPNSTSNLRFHWSTDSGRVTKGQGTRRIGVPFSKEMNGTTLRARVKVGGLPAHCGNSATGNVGLISEPEPELISAFSIPTASIHSRSLTAAARKMRSRPNDQLHIIEYFPPGTSERAIQRKRDKIMAFMIGLNVDKDRVGIVTATAPRRQTRIYMVPSGERSPLP